jgi:Cation efflux family
MDGSTRGLNVLRLLPFRSSTAALRNASASERTRVIVVALAANLLVALAKLGAGVLTGSAALLAEADHSFADSLNEVLLGFPCCAAMSLQTQRIHSVTDENASCGRSWRPSRHFSSAGASRSRCECKNSWPGEREQSACRLGGARRRVYR